ncbi:MAG: GAF domain-containing protein [Chloroflexi bacterium]|nr:GAF domain-containing protein [Chloroflexota bacterium]
MNDLRYIFQNLNPLRQISRATQEVGLPQWRERIYDSMLASVLVWGLVALVPSLRLTFSTGMWVMSLIAIISYLVVTILFVFRKKIPYTLRAVFFVLVALVLGISVFFTTIDEELGFFWIFIIPPLASLLLGLKWGLFFSGVNVVLMIGIGILVALGFGSSVRVSEFTVENWVVHSVNFIAANSVVTVPLGALLDGLFHSAELQRRRLLELEAIREVTAALRTAERLDEMFPLLLNSTLRALNMNHGSVWLYNETQKHLEMVAARGYVDKEGREISILPQKPGEGISGFVFSTGLTFQSSEFKTDQRIPEYARSLVPPGIGGVGVPIRSDTGILGVLIVNIELPRVAEENEVNLLSTLAEIAGNAIQRSTLHKKTEQQLSQFKALSEIDRAILSSLDLKYNLKLLTENVVQQLGVDAAAVMLLDPILQTFKYVQGAGFRTQAFEGQQVELGAAYAGKVAVERKIIHVDQLQVEHDNPQLADALASEGFASYYGIPLIAKGELRGVLEIYHRSALGPDEEWFDLLNSLATRAALAIDTIMMLDNLERSHQDLVLSYDATIEGWSRALDLRDQETEGHSQRVAELALEVAKGMGLSAAQLVHFRRGALLHDIGKMGVPDHILFKPGKLTDEDWKIMKQHTVFARDMLRGISYLKDALEIPYSHHERWDGSGYPLGLKGEEIPLAARIFAVADVYDALTSDRPYRKAWTKEQATAYIQEQSGKHFDSNVVQTFFKLGLA